MVSGMRTHTALPPHVGPHTSEANPTPPLAPTPGEPPGRLLVAEDVAALLGVPPAFVYALARRGELPAVRVGERYIRFRRQAIEDWVAARESTHRRGSQ
jgi:excisionase family DNA binding protein